MRFAAMVILMAIIGALFAFLIFYPIFAQYIDDIEKKESEFENLMTNRDMMDYKTRESDDIVDV